MEKVYARARDLNYQYLEVILKGKRKVSLIESNVFHPLYLEVIQPDKLDNEAFNVVIVAPYNYKGARRVIAWGLYHDDAVRLQRVAGKIRRAEGYDENGKTIFEMTDIKIEQN